MAEKWMGLSVDTKGAIYEGLLERNAAEVKSGAGQYFTPRPLIDAIVTVMDPQPGQSIHDPACGTGGFLLSAWDHMKRHPRAADRRVQTRMRTNFSGVDIVPDVVRLCAHEPLPARRGDRRKPDRARGRAELARLDALRCGSDQSAVRPQAGLQDRRR